MPCDERDFCFSGPNPTVDFEPQYSEFLQTEQESGHAGILQNFTNSILENEPLISEGKEGIAELIISNAAYLSAQKGEWIDLPFSSKRYNKFLRTKSAKGVKTQPINASKFRDSNSDRWKVNW